MQVTCKPFLARCHGFFKNLEWCSWYVLTSSSSNMQNVPKTLYCIPQVTCKMFPIRSKLSVKALEIQSWYVVTFSYSYDWMTMSWWSSLSHTHKFVEVMFFFSSAPFSAWGPAFPADCFILASLQMCFREGINPNPCGDLGAYCGGSRLAGGLAGVLPQEVGWKLVHCLRCWCDWRGLGGFQPGRRHVQIHLYTFLLIL